MIIHDSESIEVKNNILKRFPYAELINTNETLGFVDPEITDSLLVTTKKNYVFLETQDLNTITSVSSLLNSQISKERDIKLMTTYRSDIYENENISFEHLGNLNFIYPSYYKPIYDKNLQFYNEDYITEFGKTPLFTQADLNAVGVDMVLYPLTAFRAMSQSAENVYNSVIKDGTQEPLLDIMQTREELYEVLDYYNFEKELDDKLSKE